MSAVQNQERYGREQIGTTVIAIVAFSRLILLGVETSKTFSVGY